MAFQTAAGYNNLPNGNFSSVIYSKKVQLAFRKKTLVGDITNNEYFGEIAGQGDTVRIMKEPEVTVKPYARGGQVTAQDLDDEDFSLVIDKSNYFAFKCDDIEEAHSHINFMDLATNRAAYRLADQHDQEVLGYLTGYKQSNYHENADTVNDQVNGTKAIPSAGNDELLAGMKLSRPNFGNLTTPGATGDAIPVSARLPGATSLPDAYVSPVMLINRMAALLDKQYVPREGRWLVIDPDFIEILQDEDSRFLNSDFGQNGALRSGDSPTMIGGFKIYTSNNLPVIGNGAANAGAGAQSDDYGVIVAGHNDAVATAEQINKTEAYRDPDSFADVVRGMHLYGRKILRAESLVTARWNRV